MSTRRAMSVIALVVLALGTGAMPAQAQGREFLVEIPGVEIYPVVNPRHLPGDIDYPLLPPPGGPHAPIWQNCGVYDQPVRTEFAVHSLEHGAMWLTYRPDLPAGEVQALRDLARGQLFVLLSPWASYPPLSAPVVATAWGLQLRVDNATDPRVAEFVRRFANGPQNPEPGAPCHRGGTGTPLANP